MAYKFENGRVIINDLRLHAYHGVLPQEHLVGHDYNLSISADYDLQQAAETDDLAYALNYAELCDIAKEEMQQPSKLLENVAMRIAQRLLDTFALITTVSVTVEKLCPPLGLDCAGAAVQVCLTNNKT